MHKISIIIPTYNCAKYLAEALDSLISQSYQDFEIIVVDDGSTDNTKELIDTYNKKQNNKINYFYQKNRGPSAARNLGLKFAKGEIIAFLDADDIWLPDFLEKTLTYLENNHCDVVLTDYYADFYNESQQKIKSELRVFEPIFYNNDALYKSLFRRFQGGFGGTLRIIIRKCCFDTIGLFDEHLIFLEDWDLWLRIAKNNLKVGHLREPLVVYRRHDLSLCRNPKNAWLQINSIYHAFEKNNGEAFKKDASLRRNVSDTFWLIGTRSIINKIDLWLGIRCLVKSQMYFFNFKKLLSIFRWKRENGN